MLINRISFYLNGLVKSSGSLRQLRACANSNGTQLSDKLAKKKISSADQQFDCSETRPTDRSAMVRILNVAEKNDAAKNIAHIMSGGQKRMRNSYSTFNKIYEFDKNMPRFGQSHMLFYSVAGHLLDKDFDNRYRKWYSCEPLELFEAPIVKFVPDNFKNIKRSLEKEVRTCDVLIIWTDCDREGENIGFEIIEVCQQAKSNIQVWRARFSQITNQAITRAINNLVQPDRAQHEAVEVRRELDLRIGAAFTRFQTLQMQQAIQAVREEKSIVSYGSCQFPTLGFVVDRYLEIKNFVPQNFWYLNVVDDVDGNRITFNWKRVRLFDAEACTAIYLKMLTDPVARVISVQEKPTFKYRPQPMDTISLEKLASSKLKISAKQTMAIAEKLYQQAIISYPRTETNRFENDINLQQLVQDQVQDPRWGQFANGVLQFGPRPRNGNKSDQAHPPIHPLKWVNNLSGNEARVYELIVRHFLACVSADAVGKQVKVRIKVEEEEFETSGLTVIERNFLDVYPYVKWVDKELPNYVEGSTFNPAELMQHTGSTTAPALLTEADLISLMEKHGIGTDATHAEHIETIQKRLYAEMNRDRRFLPMKLGLGLVNGYVNMGLELSKPRLRAGLERDLQAICDGRRNAEDVLRDQIRNYKQVFIRTKDAFNVLILDVKRAQALREEEFRI